MSDSRRNYLEVTQDAGRAFLTRGIRGEVVMLNLLRFRDIADYSRYPDLAPAEPITGRAAYDRYIEHATPFLEAAGSTVDFSGSGGPFLIGPPDETWDLVLLVRHPSVDEFMKCASNPAYQAGLGHRQAAIADSRLLPVVRR
jgi:uncharacterized protein (DUF1330 family)